MIKKIDFDAFAKKQELDVSSLTGVYFLNLKTEGGVVSKKLVLK